MRKYVVLLSILLAFASLPTSAQRKGSGGFTSNTFLSASGGFNGYANESFSLMDNPNWVAEVSGGKWILNSAILRAQFSAMNSTNRDSVSSLYIYGHCDFMWDPITFINGANRRRRFAVYPFLGFGFMIRPSSYTYHGESPRTGNDTILGESWDKDFNAVVGLNMEYAFSSQMLGFVEAKYFLTPIGFDRNIGVGSIGGGVFTATAGIKTNISKSFYRRRRNGESRNPDEDWFICVMAGPTYFNYNNSNKLPARTKLVGGAGEFSLGKYFTSKVAFRLQAGGGIFGFANINVPYSQAHFDVMLNAHNINRFVRRRPNNLSPYAGCGIIKRADTGTMLFAADAGVQLRHYLNKHSDIVADLRYTMIPPRFMNEGEITYDQVTHDPIYPDRFCTGQNSFSVGLVTLMVGYQYNLGYGRLR